MTDRLYYTDSYLTEFDAQVLEVQGNRVRLDRSAFYPTSGGQPFDTGYLGEARVTDAEGATRVAVCSGGMIGVDGGEVRIMATTFEWADDIDLERAQRAQKEALERLESLKLEDRDFSIAEAKLKRALARIHAKE